MRLFDFCFFALFAAVALPTAASAAVPNEELSCIISVMRTSPNFRQATANFPEKIPLGPTAPPYYKKVRFIKYRYLYKGKSATVYVGVIGRDNDTYQLLLRKIESSSGHAVGMLMLNPGEYASDNPLSEFKDNLWNNCAAKYEMIRPVT